VRRNNNDDDDGGDGGDDDDKITGREKKRSGAQGDRRPGQNSVAAVAQLFLLCRPP